MTRILTAAALLTLLAVAVAAPAAERGKLEAVAVDQAPKIDGKLDDAVWKKAPELTVGKCTSDETWRTT